MPRSNLQTRSNLASQGPSNLDYNAQLAEFQGSFGSDGPIGQLPTLPQTSAWQQTQEKQAREASTTTGDYVTSALRQDTVIDGAVASYVGSQYKPDPSFSPYDPKTYAELTKDVPEEFHNELLKATSLPHALYIKGRIDDKVTDMRRLGDLGFTGNAARMLAGFVMPENLVLGLASGGVTSLVRGAGMATRIGAGLAAGGASGYAFERSRQAYNFEDNQKEAVWAGLMGMAFSAPFVGLHAREQSRIRQIATRELEVLNAHATDHVTAASEAAARDVEAHRAALAPEYAGDPVANENAPVPKSEVMAEATPTPETLLSTLDGGGKTGGENIAPVEGNTGGTAPLPDGFTGASMGSSSSGQAVPVEITAMSKARFDIYSRLNKSENPVVQQGAEMMVKDAIGKVDAEGAPIVQRRTASEDKKMMVRTIAGGFHFAARQAYDEAAKALGWGWFERTKPSNVDNFYNLVGKALRDERVFAENPDIEPMLRKAVSSARDVYSTMLDHMQKAGVHGSETLAANPDYMNRVWLQSRIREMANLHGRGEVEKLFANAIRDKTNVLKRARANDPTSTLSDHEILQKSAGKFVDSVMALEHSHLSTELLLTATDAPTLRAELKRAKLSDAEAESVINHLFEHNEATSGDAGKPAPLKYRFNLDESTRHTTAKGETVGLSDLMENDSRVLVDRYMSSMAGHTAMARRGVKSRAEFNAILRAADENHGAEGMARDAKRFADEKQMLQDVYDHTVGRPMSLHSFNTLDRLANVARTYGRSVYLGQLGFTAAHEAFHSAGLMTWRAAFQQMPSLREFVSAVRSGNTPTNGLANDVRQMLGSLNEHVSGYMRQHEITDFTYDKQLHRVENVANALSHATDKFSGNSFMTSLTRGMAAAGTIQKYANFARDITKLTPEQRKRLVGAGMHSGDIDKVLAHLKDHVELDGNRVTGVKWEEWSAKDPGSYHDFLTAVDREVRQGVQDHDIGETWYLQHSSIGKIFTELRAFNIAGHSKQFLNSLHYRDRTSLQLWTTSFVVNAMAYVTQTGMNFAHNPAELDKRLTTERIVRAAYQRSNMLGLMPFITDTVVPGFVSPYTKGSGQGLTANTDARNLLMPPSFNLLARGVNFMQNGNPKDALTVLPGSNTYGARNLIDMIGQAYKPHPHTP